MTAGMPGDDPDPHWFVSRFICSDCGLDVTVLGLYVCPVPPLCSVCAWLVEFQDEPG